MICWYCHWGWPAPVAEIFLKARDALGGDDSPLRYGPAHVVWDDENWDHAGWCLAHFEKYKGDYTDEELLIVRRSLEELAALPVENWDVVPDDYDGEHPEQFPPPPNVKMVQV